MARIALVVEYDGTDFFGWQTQQQTPTLQQVLEQAVSRVADHSVAVTACGRTDTGVHAAGQVVHFDSEAKRSPRAWALGINSLLPATFAVVWAGEIGADFHARYSARLRRYEYCIQNRPHRTGLHSRFAVHQRLPMDLVQMQRAAAHLLGEQDFTSFRTIACQSASPVRYMHRILIQADAENVIVRLEANAFLHHMCRNIVGSLLKVGRGECAAEWLGEVLRARDRKLAGATAPAHGLCFIGPLYPQGFSLPDKFQLREILPEHHAGPRMNPMA